MFGWNLNATLSKLLLVQKKPLLSFSSLVSFIPRDTSLYHAFLLKSLESWFHKEV